MVIVIWPAQCTQILQSVSSPQSNGRASFYRETAQFDPESHCPLEGGPFIICGLARVCYRGAIECARLGKGSAHANGDFCRVRFDLATTSLVNHAFGRFNLFVAIVGTYKMEPHS